MASPANAHAVHDQAAADVHLRSKGWCILVKRLCYVRLVRTRCESIKRALEHICEAVRLG